MLLCPHQGAPVPPPPVGFCADLPVMPVLAAIWMSQVGQLLRFWRGHVNAHVAFHSRASLRWSSRFASNVSRRA